MFQLLNNDNSVMMKSKSGSLISNAEEVRTKDKSMIVKALKYCKLYLNLKSVVEQKYPEFGQDNSKLLRSEQKCIICLSHSQSQNMVILN